MTEDSENENNINVENQSVNEPATPEQTSEEHNAVEGETLSLEHIQVGEERREVAMVDLDAVQTRNSETTIGNHSVSILYFSYTNNKLTGMTA